MTATITMHDHRSLFRQFLGGAYDAILITDPNGHLLMVNPRATEYFGYEQEEIEDRPVSTLIPGVTPAVVQRIRQGLSEQRHMMIDANCLRKDASKFPAEVSVSVIDLVNPGDLVFTVRSTERRRNVMQMLRSKECVFDLSQAALFTCDADGAFRIVNSSFNELFGLAEGEAQKKSFIDLFDDDPLPGLFRDALEKGEQGSVRLTVPADDGEETLDIRIGPDRSGKKIVGVAGSVIRV